MMRRLSVPMSSELAAAVDRGWRAADANRIAVPESESESDAALTRRLGRIVDDALNQ